MSGVLQTGKLPIDIFESMDIPEPQREREEFRYVGASRHKRAIIENGFPPQDGTLELAFQEGHFIALALGGVSNTSDGAGEHYHTVTVADSLPTFVLHVEQELTDADVRMDLQGLRMDLQGCYVRELTISAEVRAKVTQSAEITVLKSITSGANDITATHHATQVFNWTDVSTVKIDYNGSTILDNDDNAIDKIEVTFTNAVDAIHPPGDNWAASRFTSSRPRRRCTS